MPSAVGASEMTQKAAMFGVVHQYQKRDLTGRTGHTSHVAHDSGAGGVMVSDSNGTSTMFAQQNARRTLQRKIASRKDLVRCRAQ